MFLPSVDTNMFFGYKHVFWLRNVHHRCHILKVSTQYRYGNVSLMHHLLRSVHHITTYITFIGFFTSMDTDMFLQMTTCCELGTTVERILPRMDTEMSLQMTIC